MYIKVARVLHALFENSDELLYFLVFPMSETHLHVGF